MSGRGGTAAAAVPHDTLSRSPVVAQLVATIAHKVRNALAAMSSILELLALNRSVPPELLDTVDILSSEVDGLAAVINDLVAFAPLQTPVGGCDLCDRICQALQVLQQELEGQGTVVDHEISPLAIALDPRVADQVVLYLLRYLVLTHPLPRLSIRYGSFTQQREHLPLRHFSCCCIGSCDIDPQDVQEKDFEALGDVEPLPGAGFGIDLCDAILRSCRGQLRYTRDDGGVSFCIRVLQSTSDIEGEQRP